MNILKKSVVYIICVFLNSVFAQGIAIGQWRDHLPYNNCISVAEAGNRIYCAAHYSMFYYDKNDNTLQRLTKINGLSDLEISAVNYSETHKILLIAYTNTNIDLIQNNRIINISDIKRKSVLGNKTINNILFVDDYAYLSCGFGIVVLDIARKEIKDTYYIGPNGEQLNVLDMAFDGSTLFAATEKGIYTASVDNPNLSNYTSWSKDTLLNEPDGVYNFITYFNNKIYINKSSTVWNTDSIFYFENNSWKYFDLIVSTKQESLRAFYNHLVVTNNNGVFLYDTNFTVINYTYNYLPETAFPNDAILDKDDNLWIADQRTGLIKSPKQWQYEKMKPEGPPSINTYSMYSSGNNLWVAPGGRDISWHNLLNTDGIFSFINERWAVLNRDSIPALDTIYDIMSIVVDPGNNQKIYAGSWGNGLLQFTNNKLTDTYNEGNSTLRSRPEYYWIGIAGLCFDNQNNLWVTNSYTTFPLSVRLPNGTWKSFNLNSLANNMILEKIIIDSYNQKWIILSRGNGLLVFSDNSTPTNTADDQVIKLNTSIGNGHLPSNDVKCIAEDLDGEIWVGTDIGIAVFYSPENVFSNNDFDAQQILVEWGGYPQFLFESEVVTAIAVDGSNKKWIGTEKAGVFLMSADGTEQIHHFTTENSPLFSNSITCIAINHVTGEVFFGTEKGIVSYKGNATWGDEIYQDTVYAYPNPVRENYNGWIGIKGLVRDADVKITNVSGNLIYTTKAEGGQATWNAKNFNGERAKTGVYLVFTSNEDGSETLVTKILVIN